MTASFLNKTFQDLSIRPKIYINQEICLPSKIDRRISVDTYYTEGFENDKFQDDLLCKRTDLEENKPPFDIFCSNYGNENNGRYIRKMRAKEIYLFICCIGHKFMLTKKQILTSSWCSKCSKTYTKIKKNARTNQGCVLSESLFKKMRFKCFYGHEFTLNYKKAVHNWCAQCSNNTKKKLKDLIEQETRLIEKQMKDFKVI